MKFRFIAEKVASFTVTAMCDVLGVSTSGFYAWQTRSQSQRAKRDQQLGIRIESAHEASRGVYGSPRVAAQLRAQGECISNKRVARIMQEKGIQGRRRRRFRATTYSTHSVNIAPNLLARNFSAPGPNRVWVTDVTAVYTGTGWLYLAVILDLFSRAAVGWATSTNNDTRLALSALRAAVRHRNPPPGLIHHSDRGAPYASHEYTLQLHAHGMRASMSRTGDCWDNAVAEAFFASLKGEHLDHSWYPSQLAARIAIADYINNFYNPQRRHSTLGYLSPSEFELRAHVAKLAA
jgi:putative transposase